MQDHTAMIAADVARYLRVPAERISILVRKNRLVGGMVAGHICVFTRVELDASHAQAAIN